MPSNSRGRSNRYTSDRGHNPNSKVTSSLKVPTWTRQTTNIGAGGISSRFSPDAPVVETSDLLAGLLAYYKLDEAGFTPRADSIGTLDLSERAASVVGSAAGLVGNGAVFIITDETDGGCLYTPTATNIFSAKARDGVVCIVGWAKFAAVAANPTILMCSEDGKLANYEYLLRLDGDHKVELICDSFEPASLVFDLALSVDTWYMVAMYNDVETGHLGLSVNAADWTVSDPPVIPLNVAHNLFQLSGGPIAPGRAPESNAIFDEFGVWGRILTDANLISLYNAGSGKTYPF